MRKKERVIKGENLRKREIKVVIRREGMKERKRDRDERLRKRKKDMRERERKRMRDNE